jgi:hypothetical protein
VQPHGGATNWTTHLSSALSSPLVYATHHSQLAISAYSKKLKPFDITEWFTIILYSEWESSGLGPQDLHSFLQASG